jgi:hypothetical protein
VQDIPVPPQVVVANRETLAVLGRLGRHLSSLPGEGPRSGDPGLLALGRHLRFIHQRASVPGQQIVLVMTELLNSHWVVPEGALSLAAMYSAIAGSARHHGARVGPDDPIGDDEAMPGLVRAVRKEHDARSVGPSLDPLKALYRPLAEGAWRLLWEGLERLAARPEAPSVARRWNEDARAYKAHMVAMRWPERRSPSSERDSADPEQIDRAQRLLVAEEACDDALRMRPYLARGEAVEGRVTAVDLDSHELCNGRPVRRPVITVAARPPCVVEVGARLYWTAYPKVGWRVEDVANVPGPSVVRLKLCTAGVRSLPQEGDRVCFSIHTTAWDGRQRLELG